MVLPAVEAPVVPLVLPAPVPDVTGPVLIVPPLVVLPVVPEVELPAEPFAAPPLSLTESCGIVEEPFMSELPFASESVSMSPEPVLGSLELLPPLHALKESAAPSRATAKRLKCGLFMSEKGMEKKSNIY